MGGDLQISKGKKVTTPENRRFERGGKDINQTKRMSAWETRKGTSVEEKMVHTKERKP